MKYLSKTQRGFGHILLILSVVGVLSFIIIANFAPFKDFFLTSLYPKDDSLASSGTKSDIENYLNPFGDPWAAKKWVNPDIPIALSACFNRTLAAWNDRPAEQISFNRFLPEYGTLNGQSYSYPPVPLPSGNGAYSLKLSAEYINFIKNQNTPWYFDSCVQRAGPILRDNMNSYKITNQELRKIKPNLKANGYYVFNFLEEDIYYKKDAQGKLLLNQPVNDGYAGYRTIDLREEWFIHDKTKPVSRESRLRYFGERGCTDRDINGSLTGKYLLDVTNPSFQDFIASTVKRTMVDNGVDYVLIDYAVAMYPPKCVTVGDTTARITAEPIYPGRYWQDYLSSTRTIFSKIRSQLSGTGKLVLFNPYRGNESESERYNTINPQFLSVTDGAYWENPFVLVERNTHLVNGQDTYFDYLKNFYDAAASRNKYLFIQVNSGIDLFAKGAAYCTPEYTCVFNKAMSEADGFNKRLAEEKRLARLNTALHLIFMGNRERNPLMYITLAKEGSYQTSEANFRDWDLKIGAPVGRPEKVQNFVYKRVFGNGQVWVNYSDQPYTIPAGILTCESYNQGVCDRTRYKTADGVPVTSYTLQPQTAMFFVIPSVETATPPPVVKPVITVNTSWCENNQSLIPMTWTAPPGATSYNIFRSGNTTPHISNYPNTHFTDGRNAPGLSGITAPGSNYYYVVQALNSSGQVISTSDQTAIIKAATCATTPTPTPTILKSTGHFYLPSLYLPVTFYSESIQLKALTQFKNI